MSQCRLKFVVTNTSDRFCLCIPGDHAVSDVKERIKATLTTTSRYNEMLTKPNIDIILKVRLDDGFDYHLFSNDVIKHVISSKELLVVTIEELKIPQPGLSLIIMNNTNSIKNI